MDINKMSVTELKALAYDIISQLEKNKANLNSVNSLIREKSNVNGADSGEGIEEAPVGEPAVEEQEPIIDETK